MRKTSSFPVIALLSFTTITSHAAFLGAGFDSDRNKSLQSSCLAGSITTTGQADVDITASFDSVQNIAELNEVLFTKVNGEPDLIEKTTNETRLEFKRLMTEGVNTYPILITYKYKAREKTYSPNNEGLLNEFGRKALKQGSDTFQRLCGNSYVSQFEQSGKLFFGIQLEFDNKGAKQAFVDTTDLNFNNLEDIEKALTRANRLGNSKFHVTTMQIGGQELSLGEILGGTTNNGTSCNDAGNLLCNQYLDSLAKYTSPDGGLMKSWKSGTAVTDIRTSKYSDLPLGLDEHHSELTDDISDSRNKIAREFENQQRILAKIDSVLRLPNDGLTGDRWERLKNQYRDIKIASEYNVQVLAGAMNTCHTDLGACYSTSVNTLANLDNTELPADPHAVYQYSKISARKGGTELFCRIPETAVIVGLGARIKNDDVKGIRLGFRELDENGTLGEIQYKQCGSGSERYVEVPAGYAVTGIKLRVKNDNIAAVSLLSREWDAEKRKLIGPVASSTSGRGFELSLDTRKSDNLNTNHAVLTGIGLKASSDNLSGMTATIGWIE
ncbi:hypothetical protein [Hahella ganghwensis]|uniref:hypothetical protein n=1 Tax=Hahella ganghwensis TaxID=286420 RepID=UPI00036363C8|nr:hypothetical protein [Hahella ganghwensis]